jgi:hypothetical protein
MTFGVFNVRSEEIKTAMSQRTREVAELYRREANEAARREQLARIMATPTVPAYQVPMPARPTTTTTDCQKFGNMMNCSSTTR